VVVFVGGLSQSGLQVESCKVARSEGNVRGRPLGANAVANGGRKAKSTR
jgi:hypothetical protein